MSFPGLATIALAAAALLVGTPAPAQDLWDDQDSYGSNQERMDNDYSNNTRDSSDKSLLDHGAETVDEAYDWMTGNDESTSDYFQEDLDNGIGGAEQR